MTAKCPMLPGFERPERRSPRVMAKVLDAGDGYALFQCPACGWNSGWIEECRSVSKVKRGIPCPSCNGEETE